MTPSGAISDAAPPSFVSIQDSIVVNYVTAAMLTWVVHDWFVSFEKEVELVWKRRPKTMYILLYLFIRYYTIISLTLNLIFSITEYPYFGRIACMTWIWFHILSGVLVNQALGELLMAIRIWTVYGRNIRVLVVLCTLIGIRLGIMALWIVVEFLTLKYVYSPGAPHQCGSTPPKHIWVIALSCIVNVIVSGALCFLVTLRVRSGPSESWFDVFTVKSRVPIIRRFLRNGGVYFACAFAAEAVYAGFVLGLQHHRGPLQTLVFPMSMGAYSISSTRLALDMRDPDITDEDSAAAEIELPSRELKFASRNPAESSSGASTWFHPES